MLLLSIPLCKCLITVSSTFALLYKFILVGGLSVFSFTFLGNCNNFHSIKLSTASSKILVSATPECQIHIFKFLMDDKATSNPSTELVFSFSLPQLFSLCLGFCLVAPLSNELSKLTSYFVVLPFPFITQARSSRPP